MKDIVMKVPEQELESKHSRSNQEINFSSKENSYHFFYDEFFQKTGVRINNLSTREQAWFLKYTLNNQENKDKIFVFVKEYGKDGLKAFLTMEYGEENGDKILFIGENMPKVEAKIFFRSLLR